MNVVPKLNGAGQRLFPTLPDGMASGQSKGASWEMLGGDGAKEGTWGGGGRRKQHPSI